MMALSCKTEMVHEVWAGKAIKRDAYPLGMR